MKKIFIYLFLIINICLISLSPKQVSAKSDLDYIHNYEVTVTPREDGTLYISVYLKWEVLDSKSEGPLTWIKYGVPNCYVDEFDKGTTNIRKLSYMHEDSSSYIRIDLNKAYRAGEIVDIEFSYHLSRMYFLSGNQCKYDFVPGWFYDIKVKQMTVKWASANVIETNLVKKENGYYYITRTNLNYSETIQVQMTYNQSSFVGLNEQEQYSDEYMPRYEILFIFLGGFAVFTLVIIIISLIQYSRRDRYMEHRGFVRHGYYYHHYHHRYRRNTGVNKTGKVIVNPTINNGSGGSSGGSCACACACACAGGGRAGCSRKDFYNTNIQIEKIIEHIE